MTTTKTTFTDDELAAIIKSLAISEDVFAKRLQRLKGTDRYDNAHRDYIATGEALDKARLAQRHRLTVDAT